MNTQSSSLFKSPVRLGALLAFTLLLSVWITGTGPSAAQSTEIDAVWEYTIPNGDQVKFSSPVLANISGDANLEVIVATDGGYVIALDSGGNVLWNRNMLDFFSGYSAMSFRGTIAVADLENDGDMEIIVPIEGHEYSFQDICIPGSVMVLDHTGNAASGAWPFIVQDGAFPPVGCPDGVLSTPAVGDIDQDGQKEIVVGSLDKRIYALNPDGSLLPGFPPDSAHAERFPVWDVLKGQLSDTIIGSAALADLTGDGYLEIFITTDEGNFDGGFGGNTLGWYCPFPDGTPNTTDGYCGGTMQVLNYKGERLDNFPTYTWEALYSSPSIVDVNGDGTLDIVSGAGHYYQEIVNAGGDYANRVYVWDGTDGTIMDGWNDRPDLPEWGGGKVTNGPMMVPPSIGDITGDGEINIVAATRGVATTDPDGINGTIYAWNRDGSLVSGFPMTPRDNRAFTNNFFLQKHILLADVDGDFINELVMYAGINVVVVDGDGTQLTNNGSNSLPYYSTNYGGNTAPAIADIDNDCKLEVVTADARVHLFEFADSSTVAAWPQVRNTVDRTAQYTGTSFAADVSSSTALAYQKSSAEDAQASFVISNPGTDALTWTLTITGLTVSGATADKTSGTLAAGTTVVVTLTIPRAELDTRANGYQSIGSVSVNVEDGCAQGGRNLSVPVSALIADELEQVFLPMTQD